MLVGRYPNHGFSKILIDSIGNTCYSFVHQTLSLIKLKNSIPRHVSDTPQQLFISHDINTMINSIPVLNNCLRQAQSLSQQCTSIVNQCATTSTITMDRQPSAKCGNATSSPGDIYKRPPSRIENSILEVLQQWIENKYDDTLDVLSEPYLKRKIWMNEKGMRCNFNKRKSIIGIICLFAHGTVGRVEAAIKLDEDRKAKNQSVSLWWRQNKLSLAQSESNE